MLHDLVKARVGVIDEQINRIDHLAEIVRRYVCRHTDGDTCRSVAQQVRETRRQNRRLLKAVVIVSGKINRFLFNIGQHGKRHFTHAAFCVSIGCRRISIDRTKVAVSIDQRIPHGKILRQPHHCIVNRRVSVRMVTAKHRSNGISTFAVRLVRRQAVFMQRIQDTPVYRL